MSPKELKSFLQDINIEVDEDYTEMLFEVIFSLCRNVTQFTGLMFSHNLNGWTQ